MSWKKFENIDPAEALDEQVRAIFQQQGWMYRPLCVETHRRYYANCMVFLCTMKDGATDNYHAVYRIMSYNAKLELEGEESFDNPDSLNDWVVRTKKNFDAVHGGKK